MKTLIALAAVSTVSTSAPPPSEPLSIITNSGHVLTQSRDAQGIPFEPRPNEYGVFLGQGPVDDWRFIEILEHQRSATAFTESVRMRHLGHKALWWGAGLGGLTLSYLTLSSVYNREGRSPALHEIFLIPTALIGGVVCLPVAAFWEPRQFTFAEAVGAVDEYNKANR